MIIDDVKKIYFQPTLKVIKGLYKGFTVTADEVLDYDFDNFNRPIESMGFEHSRNILISTLEGMYFTPDEVDFA